MPVTYLLMSLKLESGLGCKLIIGWFFIRSKDAPQKLQFIRAIKKVASLNHSRQNAKYYQNLTKHVATCPKQLGIPIPTADSRSPVSGLSEHVWCGLAHFAPSKSYGA